MLRQTFVHLPGIGLKTERGLWSQGCHDWDCYLSEYKRYSVGSASKEVTRREVEKSAEALENGIHQYFRRKLRQKQTWRAFEDFRHSCVYLDIETDGTAGGDGVTVIGLYDGREYTALVQGDSLENFRDYISNYSMIVTFFGSGFDLPVLEKRFRGVVLDQIHIDLCPTLRSLGYRGGLKKIEKEFGIERPEETEGLTGWDAVLLWRAYQRHDESALDRLIAYNREDVVNLERLAEIAFKKLTAAVRDY